MKKILKMGVLGAMVLMSLSGCSQKHDGPWVYKDVNDALGKESDCTAKSNVKEWKTKPYQTNIKPIVGSRQNDAKVIVDTGKVLKIWVAPYKQARTLISAHDVYSMVEKPDFIVGEMVPSGQKNRGLLTADNDYPFMFKDRHLETVNPETRFSDKNIKEYVNNVYKSESNPEVWNEKREESNERYDNVIKNYIK